MRKPVINFGVSVVVPFSHKFREFEAMAKRNRVQVLTVKKNGGIFKKRYELTLKGTVEDIKNLKSEWAIKTN